MLTSLDSPEARRHIPHDDLTENAVALANQIITVADAIITNIDQDKLLAYYGLKNDQRPDAAKIKTTMEKQKSSLIEGLVKKGCALARLYIHGTKTGEGDGSYEHLLESVAHHWQEVQKFAEPTDNKVIMILSLCVYLIFKVNRVNVIKNYQGNIMTRECGLRLFFFFSFFFFLPLRLSFCRCGTRTSIITTDVT